MLILINVSSRESPLRLAWSSPWLRTLIIIPIKPSLMLLKVKLSASIKVPF